jgi:hypothetical protein
VAHHIPHHRQEQRLCTRCGFGSSDTPDVVIQGLMGDTMDVLVGLHKRMCWPAISFCEDCGDIPGIIISTSSSSSCACRCSSTGRIRPRYPLGWPGGKDQTVERVGVPSTMLSFLAFKLHTLVTYTFPSQLGRRVFQQMVKPHKMSWEAELMSKSVPRATQALLLWAEGGGGLPEQMWGGEGLRVPLLVANALLMAVPVDFACNNPDCLCLDGPWELGLVNHRAKVVCGGCGVARYCSRNCQEQHWKWHMDACRELQGSDPMTETASGVE